MNEYYYYNTSNYRILYELFELLKYGKLKAEEITNKFEISTRQFRKDIACIKSILYDFFEYDIDMYYVFSKKEYQIVFNKGISNNLFLPFKF